jgi:Single-stranded DNA-binding protein
MGMANKFSGTGNLADTPTVKSVTVRAEAESRTVAEMRIYFDRSVPDGNGGFRDAGGFWLTCNLWGRRAEAPIIKQLTKGMRVHVEGTLSQESWEDSASGTQRTAMRLDVDYLALDPGRIQSVSVAASRADQDPRG